MRVVARDIWAPRRSSEPAEWGTPQPRRLALPAPAHDAGEFGIATPAARRGAVRVDPSSRTAQKLLAKALADAWLDRAATMELRREAVDGAAALPAIPAGLRPR